MIIDLDIEHEGVELNVVMDVPSYHIQSVQAYTDTSWYRYLSHDLSPILDLDAISTLAQERYEELQRED